MSDPAGPALIVGATSDIGRAISRALAAQGYALQLAGRNIELLSREASDLETRYRVRVSCHSYDALTVPADVDVWAALDPLPEIVVCVIGLLGVHAEDQHDLDAAERTMITNYLAPARLMADFANRFAARGSGTLVGVSSVAGDRGRASNYIYGSAKAGFSAFLSGLRNRLGRQGVQVVTVKPGFVRTRMTAGKSLPNALTATPERVAAAVVAAIDRRQDVVYVLPIWRLIMWIIRAVPEPIFKRLRL